MSEGTEAAVPVSSLGELKAMPRVKNRGRFQHTQPSHQPKTHRDGYMCVTLYEQIS